MDEGAYAISRYLDEPMRFMLWTWDELLALGVPLIGMYCLTNGLLIGLGLGGAALLLLKKFKGDHGPGYGCIWLYWHFPEMRRLQKIPPSYLREYLS